DAKMVFFESFGGRQYACSPRAIYEAMCADPRFDGYRFVWSYHPEAPESLHHLPQMDRAATVVRGSREYWEASAKSGTWIVNTRMPEYFFPKNDQTYVQCWHGTPLKRLGFDVPRLDGALNTAEELAGRFKLDSGKWSYLVSPSPYTSLHLADAFGLPKERRADVVLEQGYPRNDRIVRESHDPEAVAALRREICARLGLDPEKKLLLYAPTWRDDCFKAGLGYVMEDTMLDFHALQREFADEWCILFRAHYYIANEFDFSAFKGFVGDASKGVDINDLYIVADALLTDYSSVFFDYANTGRPMMFFWPDFDHYANDLHGFYFDLTELPGPQCRSMDQVIGAIRDFDSYQERYGQSYARFTQKFCPLDDGHAAERVIDAVFGTGK
ncbi:MAG: CDP-glycerol glycerophosphotransferase family protein, partial [Coriobacteriaceae bacterium]|nr:CDP-glycerol glycerophosphotransferase family protein [Coriobacteriaceae bacterium]